MPKRRGQETEQAKNDDDEIFLQPWFLPKDVSLQIRMILPHIHLTKMRYYFDDHGCLRCERRDVLYGSCGLCEPCCSTVRRRLRTCLQRRLKSVGVRSARQRASYDLASPVTIARDIIGPHASKK
jgi:hypothetical protein